jgi:phosphatidylglycerol:prolipoprotein diacylglycerol transferase
MHPVLFEIGHFQVGTWGISLAISFVIGIVVAVKRAPRFEIQPHTITDLAVVLIIAAYMGSRIWYVMCHTHEFRGNWLNAVNPFQYGRVGFAGLSMVGGVALAFLVSLIYTYVKRLNFLVLGDVIAPGFLLGIGFHRLGGCFLAGCCFGQPTDNFLGVVFPPEGHLSPYPLGTPLWPTQPFASVLGFTGFILVYWLERHRRFPGWTFSMVFTYYATTRFIVDQFRYYEPSQIVGTIGPFTININHGLLIGIVIMCVFLWVQGETKIFRYFTK